VFYSLAFFFETTFFVIFFVSSTTFFVIERHFQSLHSIKKDCYKTKSDSIAA